MGLEGFAERARHELLATGETARRRTLETAAELTAQEQHIADLAAQGLTNPEIGAALYVSPRTVEWHLRKVFIKLGLSTRRELRGTPGAVGGEESGPTAPAADPAAGDRRPGGRTTPACGANPLPEGHREAGYADFDAQGHPLRGTPSDAAGFPRPPPGWAVTAVRPAVMVRQRISPAR
jgi:DNA-binding CsgD family transcriptional regulator